MIDCFEPFSGYIIAGLSSSLYSSYRHSIAAKPQIESCNYQDGHLIAALLSALSFQVLLTHHRDRGKKRVCLWHSSPQIAHLSDTFIVPVGIREN